MPQDIAGKQGSKRDKYTSRACGECQRRKVKCSGEPVCSNCQTRGTDCEYEESAPRGPKPKPPRRSHKEFTDGEISSPESAPIKRRKSRSTLRDQLAQLQEKVDALFQGHKLNVLDSSDTQELHDKLSASPFTLGDGVNTHQSTESLLNYSTYCPQPEPYNPARIFQDTDIFHARSPPCNSIALSSQIDALRKLGRNSLKARVSFEDTAELQLTIQLPDPSALWSQVTIFFAEYGCYFPCLHDDRVRAQLSAVLASLGYDDYHNEVTVGAVHCQIIAILFTMLAYAEAVTQSPTDDNAHPGARRYSEGLRLMEFFGKLHESNLQTTIFHTIAAAYLLELGMSQMAFQSVSQAFQTALCIALNNQERWPDNVEDEDLACRQSLWWTIFFLDKRIAQKIGIAYSVRQTECAVREFSGSDGSLGRPAHHELLQSMIFFSQLWAHIWDSFFSPQARKDEDPWEKMQSTDIKIILAYRRLPSSLRWRAQRVNEYIDNGDSERQIRRRLSVFLRFTFLRLSIRHKSLGDPEQDRERRKSCTSLCIAMVKAVRTYTRIFGYHKPSGHLLTSALVECLYCIISEQQQSEPVVAHQILEGVKSCASGLLYRLSLTITAASRACEALQDVLSPIDGDESYDLPCIVDNPLHTVQDSVTSLSESSLGEIWRTTSESAGQEYDPETAPQPRKAQIVPPLDLMDGFGDPLNDLVGGLDWNSLLGTLPSGYLS